MRAKVGAFLLLFSSLSSVLSSSRANAEALLGSAGNPRCGLGTMILGDKQSIVSQSTEEFSNMLMLNGAFSITTGTSGCSNSGIVAVPQEELFYANVNFEELSVEMASGRGETVSGLAHTMGCQSADVPLFLETSKANYHEVYSSPSITPLEMMINLRKRLQNHPRLSSGCRSLNT